MLQAASQQCGGGLLLRPCWRTSLLPSFLSICILKPSSRRVYGEGWDRGFSISCFPVAKQIQGENPRRAARVVRWEIPAQHPQIPGLAFLRHPSALLQPSRVPSGSSGAM